MDTWMGNNYDPITLHKYLYANADPGNYTDPTGNFGIASFGVSSSIQGILATIAVIDTGYSLFQIATGKEELSATDVGIAILLSRIPGSSFAKAIAKKFKKKTGKNLKIPCVKNSFVAGTLVHTARGLIPIEDVVIGDFVLSFREETGENEYQEVVHLIQHEGDYELVKIGSGAGSYLSTLEHPFYIDGDWVSAGDLVSSDLLATLGGFSPIDNIERIDQRTKVYNFTVANTHTYYVGEQGVLVHNTNGDCVLSVKNMDEFFELPFGALIKGLSARTGKSFKGAQIYKASKKSDNIKKGDRFYLDTLHGDHIEVFDSRGNVRTVLNLDGTVNINKLERAISEGRKLAKNLL